MTKLEEMVLKKVWDFGIAGASNTSYYMGLSDDDVTAAFESLAGKGYIEIATKAYRCDINEHNEAVIVGTEDLWRLTPEGKEAVSKMETPEPQPDGIQFRTVDDLGRICLPKDIRDKLGIKPGTECVVYATDELTSDEIIVIRRNKNDKTN